MTVLQILLEFSYCSEGHNLAYDTFTQSCSDVLTPFITTAEVATTFARDKSYPDCWVSGWVHDGASYCLLDLRQPFAPEIDQARVQYSSVTAPAVASSASLLNCENDMWLRFLGSGEH